MRKIKQNVDGSLEIKVVDTRTLEQKLNGELTFAERLAITYPTSDVDVTVNWESYDEHKFYK